MSQFEEAVYWINSLQKFGIRPGLERMEWVLERLNHPERRLKFIHIAGTNGKGSTLSFISSVLKQAGYNVGTYISPAMGDLTNRIQWNGEDIPREDFAKYALELKSLADELEKTEWGSITEFEVTTLIAILYFSKTSFPDLVVWETGLGGRLDCTNVVFPLVSAITNIGLDHVNILGDSIKAIAKEKAGIIKGGYTVTTVEDEEALDVIQSTACAKKASFYGINQQFHVERVGVFPVEERLNFYGPFKDYKGLTISLLGLHQVKNAALAVMVLELLREFYAVYYTEEDLFEGLKRAKWPGRFEIWETSPYLILDGAHNLEGVESLVQTMKERFPGKKAKLLFSALKDKDVRKMLKALACVCDEVVVTKIDNVRAAEPTDMEMWIRDLDTDITVTCIPDRYEAIEEWMKNNNHSDLLLATGSLYFIADLRRYLGKARTSFPSQGKRVDE